MSKKSNIFLKNLSFSFSANIWSMLISIILILIVPKFISVVDYGYWQLYIFYASFISYLSLGLTDGAYLRFGGLKYKELNKPLFVSQFWFLFFFDLLINISIVVTFFSFSEDSNVNTVILFTCLTGLIVVPRSLLTFMLQSTNRIKEYSIIIIIERTVYFFGVVFILIIGGREFKYLILADMLGKLCSMIYAVYVCKELTVGKFASIRLSIREIWLNISIGSKLLFSNLVGILILGIARFSIENNWGIEIFGKVSLSLSITSMLMLLVNSVAIILFPALRRVAKENLSSIYKDMKLFLMTILFGLLLLYYPAKVVLSLWLPDYSVSFTYLALLFPMCIYESKMVLLINTYLKTLRKEKQMLVINLFILCLSLAFIYISVIILNNLNLTILSLTILLAIRSIVAELYLEKLLKISLKKDILLELFMGTVFLITAWYIGTDEGLFIYLIFYFGYLLIKKRDILFSLNNKKLFNL